MLASLSRVGLASLVLFATGLIWGKEVSMGEPGPIRAAAAELMGQLEGNVSIGPLRPAERAGEPPPLPPPEAYALRSISIFKEDGATLVTSVKINPDGTYRVALPPGTYVVGIGRTGMDRARGLPKTIVIPAGQTVRLDISIDTGMR